MSSRTCHVHFRVSSKERSLIDEIVLVENKSITDVLMESLRSCAVAENLSSEYLMHLKLVRQELKRQGNNINQIARALNQHQETISKELLQHYFDTLVEGEALRCLAIENVEKEIVRCKSFGIS